VDATPTAKAVLLMMGPAGSGKSTLANRIAARHDAVIVSYDEHQRRQPDDDGSAPVGPQALADAHRELAALCAGDRLVVVDGTHCQPERRVAVRRIAAEHGRPTVVLVLLPDLATCLDRQTRRERRVPAVDVERQHREIVRSLPTLRDEGHQVVLTGADGSPFTR